jgi:CHAD domain-containing protein
VAGKKIRYALELAHESQILEAKGEVESLRRIQDALGDLNDSTVLRSRMNAFAKQAGRDERAGIGKIVTKIKRRQRRLIKRFVSDWPKVRRRLRKVKAHRTRSTDPSS